MKQDIVTTSNGIEMAYFSFGEGERRMVILPGIDVKSVLLAARAVEAAYRCFKDDYTVYVFDRRKNLPERYSVREMAEDTAAVMRELGISDADVFGASQGGMMAMYLAAQFPELVHSMVLGSTTAFCNDVIGQTVERWIALAQKRDVTALTADFVDRLYGSETVRKYRDFLMHSNDSVGAEELDRFIVLARTIEEFDARPILKNIHCPTLVIGAENDLAAGAQASREIAEMIGESRSSAASGDSSRGKGSLCELYLYGEGYGHCVFDEAPDYKERMLTFFNKHR